MKVFSKEKYLAQPFLEYLKEAALRSGWVDKCDGKPVIDGRCGCFWIPDNWCIDVPDKKKEKKKMYTMQDFIKKKIAVRTGTGEKQKKFLEMCEKEGMRWLSGHAPTDWIPHVYGAKTCIFCLFDSNDKSCHLSVDRDEYYKWKGIDVVSVDEFLRKAEKRNEYEIKICVNGNMTTAEMIVDGETVKTATAKRNPADKFNFKKGAELAFTRLFAKKTKEKSSESKRPLRMGDRVVCQAPTDGKQEIVGMHGRVITTNREPITYLGVEFDKFIDGHGCGKTGKLGYCWNCEEKTLARE